MNLAQLITSQPQQVRCRPSSSRMRTFLHMTTVTSSFWCAKFAMNKATGMTTQMRFLVGTDILEDGMLSISKMWAIGSGEARYQKAFSANLSNFARHAMCEKIQTNLTGGCCETQERVVESWCVWNVKHSATHLEIASPISAMVRRRPAPMKLVTSSLHM